MTPGTVAADPLQVGWTALRAFFREGAGALRSAVGALDAAESHARRSRDPSRLVMWLHGMATALQHTRRPEAMETALVRARELVNLIGRTQDEPATIPYRAHVEAIYAELTDVVPAQAAAYLEAGLDYSDRTLRLARKAGREEWLAVALASRAGLVCRRAGDDRRAARRAVALFQDARRRWPSRDLEGRARVGIGLAEALLAAGEPGKAELVARESLALFQRLGDRYHEADARLVLSRALFALDRSEALDEHAAAVAGFRALGCAWEARRAERALA